MRIVIVGPCHPYRGGIAKFNDTLMTKFQEIGHQVTMVNFSMQYPWLLFPGKTQYTDDPAPEDFDNHRIINSVNPFSWFRAISYIVSLKPQVVLFRYWMPFFAPAFGTMARVLRKKGIRTVALTDNIVPHEPRFYDNWLTEYFLKGIGRVVYMSSQVGLDLKQFNFPGEKIMVQHPIYDTYGAKVPREEACAHLGLDPAFRYVLFFGFVRHYKGLDMLLEAWSFLEEETPKKLIIAGEFYEDRYETMVAISDYGLADKIIFNDKYIPDDEVRYYFSAADLLVLPYRSATQSGVTQVAYHFGVPMVVTMAGGLGETVKHGEVGFVTHVNALAIQQAIDRFFDEGWLPRMRENIGSYKKRFSWIAMCRAVIEYECDYK
ncbi:MAG: glycosyltransferase [Mucinivorans sp.]